jgi:hypothetical protein
MQKLLLFLILIFVSLVGISQNAECVKGKNYKGYLFPIKHNAFIGIQNQSHRFSPDKQVIESFESILSQRIVELTKYVPDQGERCPKIQKRLQKYIRQYFGFVTTDNERILYVNFVWSKKDKIIFKKIDREYVDVSGGCSFYWNIKYNLDKDQFFDLRVNTKD